MPITGGEAFRRGARVVPVSLDDRSAVNPQLADLSAWQFASRRIDHDDMRATAESFTAGYWHSGDLGSIDEQNFVRVFDRQKDMINRGGLKIYSAEVESVLAGHPAVVESAIVARPCPVLGERVHAVVVVRSDIDSPTLRAWCIERMSDYKVPETIDITMEPLPRNANGKVMKKHLRDSLMDS